MKEISLSQDKIAFVDDEDYERVSQYKWHVKKPKNSRTYYAIREFYLDGERTTQSMHNFIMNTPEGVEIDHKEHDGLNNQKNGLRIVTHKQNLQNQQKPLTYKGKPPSSKYKGVCWDKQRKKWQAHIKVNRKKIHLGRFDAEIEAAKVYDSAAIKYFGEFAKLNLGEK